MIFERAKFNSCKQLQDKTVDSFITDLFCLAEHCAYGQLRDELIRDRLVVGLLDASLSEKMQLDPELTLDKAIALACQSEAMYKQQPVVRGMQQQDCPTVEQEKIDTLSYNNPKNANKFRHADRQRFPRNNAGGGPLHKEQTKQKCSRCGKSPKHSKQQCPAKDSTCKKCYKKGHYTSYCFSKDVSLLSEDNNTESKEDAFLGSLESHGDTQWHATVSLNQKNVKFKLDTGAEVSAISETTFHSLTDTTLKRPSKALHGPAHTPLKVIGQFTGNFKYNNSRCKLHVYVVKDLKTNLLGLPAITAPNLVARVQNISGSKETIMKWYPKLFMGLGTLGNEYKISLKPGAKPYALHTARRVPISMRKAVEKELNRMESLGVISQIDEPSPWCAEMVVVTKPSGKVRICVDMKPLIENVMREFHPLPAVDETLAQLSGARIFTKLDANAADSVG